MSRDWINLVLCQQLLVLWALFTLKVSFPKCSMMLSVPLAGSGKVHSDRNISEVFSSALWPMQKVIK